MPWPLNISEAGSDLVLLQTFLLFTCKSWYSSANKPVNMIICIWKTRFVTKQGDREPRFYSKARALSTQLLNGLLSRSLRLKLLTLGVGDSLLLPLFSFSGGGIWRRLEQLERIYGRFPSVDQSSRFAGVPNLGKPLYREKTVHIKTHKSARGPHRRDVTHILSKVSCFFFIEILPFS